MKLQTSKVEDFAILVASGRIGWNSSRILDRHVQDLVRDGVRNVVFKLDVDFLSSGAIGVLVYYLRSLQKAGGDIFLVTSNAYVYELLDAIGFLKVFAGKVFDSLESMELSLPEHGVKVPPLSRFAFTEVES